jgi:hypothetical protein
MDDQERIKLISELKSKIANQERHCGDARLLETISGPDVQNQECQLLLELKEQLSLAEGNPPAWLGPAS